MVEKRGNFLYFIDSGVEAKEGVEYHVAVKISDIIVIEEISDEVCKIYAGTTQFKLETTIDELLKIMNRGYHR